MDKRRWSPSQGDHCPCFRLDALLKGGVYRLARGAYAGSEIDQSIGSCSLLSRPLHAAVSFEAGCASDVSAAERCLPKVARGSVGASWHVTVTIDKATFDTHTVFVVSCRALVVLWIPIQCGPPHPPRSWHRIPAPPRLCFTGEFDLTAQGYERTMRLPLGMLPLSMRVATRGLCASRTAARFASKTWAAQEMDDPSDGIENALAHPVAPSAWRPRLSGGGRVQKTTPAACWCRGHRDRCCRSAYRGQRPRGSNQCGRTIRTPRKARSSRVWGWKMREGTP